MKQKIIVDHLQIIQAQMLNFYIRHAPNNSYPKSIFNYEVFQRWQNIRPIHLVL